MLKKYLTSLRFFLQALVLLSVIPFSLTVLFVAADREFSLNENIYLFGFFLIAVLIATAIFGERLILSPIRTLVNSAKQLANGELSHRISQRLNASEIRQLSESFNEMAAALEDREENLKRMHAQIVQSEKLSAMGQMAAGIAHELKNPLGVILQGASYLKTDGARSAEQRVEVITMMEDAVARADRIIKGLLHLARPIVLELKPEALNEMVEHACSLAAKQIPESITVVKEMAASPIQVLADAGQINQVVINLIMNAVHAMPEGGKLVLRTFQTHASEVRPGVGRRSMDLIKPADAVAVCEVIDSGTGILQQNQAKVFDPFFTTKKVGEGTGLGLAIVRAIVETHGGMIMFENNKGQGATFRLVLPTKA